ncbi:MAG TPA: LLM class flavin-dependent oxidoreductase [Baekduia sp.]|uniref:LLM class flavin-dependent oxidoreductase n=1 Tax=Baekduia sp. TaxID=2600305 RepID=UPI002CC75E08|nr:LLM class flavin-dependent oxidoreductase [Baekduia sp.]HMJ37606.1 LLM class flavin-dependent oxidoreductase [Baekduia sp.]
MTPSRPAPLSVLDLAPIRAGGTVGDALRETLQLARTVEDLGYHRFWLAEHHNIPGIASAATAVLIGQVAAVTERMRVGSGGVMLPNHAPMVVAEQFGTLAALYPGRIDLGLGRAPGADVNTAYALRRAQDNGQSFPTDLQELRAFLAPAQPGQRITAIPGAGSDLQILLLGSSTFSAQLAAQEGLGFAFAAHFAPQLMLDAFELYRARFRPSEMFPEPYAMVGAYVVVADTDEEARRLFTSTQQKHTWLIRGNPRPTAPPLDDIDAFWSPMERASIDSQLREAVVGSPETVRAGLESLLERTGADEVIVATDAYDFDARLRSYRLLADAWGPPRTPEPAAATAGARDGAQ